MLASALRSLVVEDARANPAFASRATTRELGIGAYTGVPVYRANGELYGTLCTLHPRARAVEQGEIALLALAGCLIMQAIDAEAARAREHEVLQNVGAAAERLHTLYAAMACGVIIMNPVGEIVDANEAALQILDVPYERLAGQSISAALHSVVAADGSGLTAADRPGLTALHTGQPVRNMTLGFARRDGERRWLQADAVPVRDTAGALAQIVVSFIDITERRRAEEAARESGERTRAILEGALDAVITIDAAGQITEFNRAAEVMFGYSRADALAHNMSDLIIAPAMGEARRGDTDQSLTHDDGPFVGRVSESTAMRASGEIFPIEIAVTRIQAQRQPLFTSYIRDITARKQAEQELERIRADFIAAVSHDLKTPLTAVRAGLGILHSSTDGRLRSGESKILETSRRNVERLGLQIDDLLAANAAVAGTLTVAQEPLDLRDVVTDAVSVVQPLLRQKAQRLEIDLREPLPVRGDARRLEQVVVNLLANAQQHTPSGTHVTVRSRADAAEIVLEVADDGPGIATDELAHVFERFYRVARASSGTGLGLAIARHIVETHGGRMWAESASGEGSVFAVALPRATSGARS